jgi:hypothetical protein
LSTDISGFALDLAGSGLELVGGDSLLDAEEAVPGELGSIGSLANPWSAGLDSGPAAGLGQASQLGTLSVPPGWANALSGNPGNPPRHLPSPPSHHGSGAAHPHATNQPMGGIVGRESAGAGYRVGVRASLIPHSPMAG